VRGSQWPARSEFPRSSACRKHDGGGQGASLRELMERMDHSSTRAALIYLHATRERDEAIAAGMGKLLTQARRTAKKTGGSGTQRARRIGKAS
jgi:hypothetical protein